VAVAVAVAGGVAGGGVVGGPVWWRSQRPSFPSSEEEPCSEYGSYSEECPCSKYEPCFE